MNSDINIPVHWQLATVNDIEANEKRATITGPFGSSIGKRFFVSEGMPVIRGNNLSYKVGTFDDSGFVYITREKANELKGYIAKPGDLIFTAAGTIGQVALIPFAARFEEYIISNKQMRVRLNLKKVDTFYAYYWFSCPVMNAYIKRQDTGSTIPLINLSVLRALPIPLPPLHEQRSIATILKSLDDKIGINYQINQTLEQMAQSIFKSWFVDFEPVKAKIATLEAGGSAEDALLAAMKVLSGKTANQLVTLSAEQPKYYAELRATAELFPSTMQDSELGEIPERWYPSRLDQNIELAYGKALKKSTRVEGKYPVYGSGGVAGSHNEFLVSGPGIIVGRKGTVGSIYWEPHNFYPIDTTFYVTVKNGYSLAFAYYLLQTLGLSEMNTDAAVPGLNRNNVYRLEVPSFPEPLISQFSQTITPLSEKISESNAESLILTQLRDSLFPKLLSGQLTVSDVKGPREEAEASANV